MALPYRPPNPALPYREDCWSEGETDVLIDAWGDRYVEVNHGSLRQQQWQEVADAVNSRPCDARRPPRTDVQCKNRIDTLKKKYKVEKSKILLNNNHPAVGSTSQWKFYHKLNELIGSSSVPLKNPLPKSASVAPPLALPLPSHRKGTPLPTASAVRPVERRRPPVVEDSFYRRNLSAAAAVEEEEEEDESEDSASRSSRSGMKRTRNGMGKDGDEEEEAEAEAEEGVRELSKAILRLAEIYERVEVEKQRQMVEIEKQKMEFVKGLEFQRMQIFLDSQVRLAKIKRWR